MGYPAPGDLPLYRCSRENQQKRPAKLPYHVTYPRNAALAWTAALAGISLQRSQRHHLEPAGKWTQPAIRCLVWNATTGHHLPPAHRTLLTARTPVLPGAVMNRKLLMRDRPTYHRAALPTTQYTDTDVASRKPHWKRGFGTPRWT